MVDAKLRWGAALWVMFASCSCNDEECKGNDCVTNLDDSSSSTGAGGTGDDDDGSSSNAAGSSEDDTNAATEGSTGFDDGQCHGTDECDGDFCVAPYADNVRGPFACVSECVGPNDESVWCHDDAACCDAAAHCTIRRYCEVDSSTSDGSTSSEESGGSTTDGGSSSTG